MQTNSEELRFDDKVVVVTGAGVGLGRTYALAFASRGAKVVVNDLGGSKSGDGKNEKAADIVVDEIRKKGGIAVANYNSVEDGQEIVNAALKAFGRIDILVNNAGILRDKSFAKLTNADWDLVQNVHLRGSFMVTRAAFPQMKKQGYGRIIMTSSTSGIYGNFGQANYSAAKLGLLGLCNTLALEGERYNIHCNTVAPMGGTRLTEGILPPDLFEELKPELVAPVVLWLCHETCEESGSVVEAAGGWFGKYRWERSRGCMCRKSIADMSSPEAVRDNWAQITDFEQADHLTSNEEAAAKIASALEELRENPRLLRNSVDLSPVSNRKSPLPTNDKMAAVGFSRKNISYTYEVKDVILYALGVGCTTKEESDLKYLYEGHEDFTCLPTFAIVPAQVPLMATDFVSQLPNWSLDLTKVLHGEQYVEVFWPIPTSGTLKSDVKVVDILDKGSGAAFIMEVNTWDEELHLVAKTQWVMFAVGAGGFGGSRTSKHLVPLVSPPNRRPDKTSTVVTSADQAALYRLSGDFNPLHIDPSFASFGGFEAPILHGLCSYGAAARSILKEFCDDDVSRFKAIKARFSKPVYPGQTLVTSMWREDCRVYFETRVKETSQICLTGGYMDIVEKDVILDFPVAPGSICDDLLLSLKADLAMISPTINWDRGVLLFVITVKDVSASYWTIDFSQKPDILKEGLPSGDKNPDSTVIFDEHVFHSILEKRDTFKAAFLRKKMKIRGALPHFTLLNKLFSLNSKL